MNASNRVPEGAPRILANFAFGINNLNEISVDYGIICKSCGEKAFQVFSFPKTVSDKDSYFNAVPGEILRLPPHKLICTACGSGGVIFDPRTDGYDAVACGFCGYETRSEGEEPAADKYFVTVLLAYNSELSELEETARDTGVAAADLFDGIVITASPIAGGDPLILDYECA